MVIGAADRRALIDLPPLPALVVGRTYHRRHRPLDHSFCHRTYLWLVDLDHFSAEPSGPDGSRRARAWWPRELPRALRPVARWRVEEHLSGAATDPASLRRELVEVVRAEGLDADRVHRIVMLTQLAVLGHVFNPLTTWWCLDADQGLVAVVLEVHNTYGGRHAYVLRPDRRGQAVVDKGFHVSPFNQVEGRYHVSVHLGPRHVAVAIRLHVAAEPVITASVAGSCLLARPDAVVRTVLTHPLMPQRVSALIRAHGVWLWARRLPVRPGVRRTGGLK